LLSCALEYVHFHAHVDHASSGFCTAGAKFDCNVVALSQWSVFLDIPVPIWGMAGFLALGPLAWVRSRWLLPFALIAAVASLGLLGIELFSIHNVCLLCEGVHLVSWGLAFLAYRDRQHLLETERITLAHIFTVPIGLLVVAHNLLSPYWATFTWKGPIELARGTDAEGHYWIGAENPKVVVHEYTDYGCAHCAVATTGLRRILLKHPGSLRIVHHNFPRMRCPLEAGELACVFARIANCAGDQGKFWEADSWLFEHAPGKVTVDAKQAARDLGLDGSKLEACMQSEASFKRADRDSQTAMLSQINDTPSYVIDGKKYLGGKFFRELNARL
jgi:uncharacterized membrane protein